VYIDVQTLTHDQIGSRPTVSAPPVGWQAEPWVRTLAGAAAAQAALLVALSLLVRLGPVGWLAALGYTAAVFAGLATGLRRAGKVSLGPADKVTLARSALVGGVTALVADLVHQPALLVTMTLTALVLDGLDGQVARRTGTASPLGARFDMEVDAFLILVLSAYVAVQVGPWILAIGLMRYGFIAAGAVLPWMRRPVPSSWAGKVVAVVQGVVLVVATAGVLPLTVTTIAVAGALAALIWSFGRSVWWLWEQEYTVAGSTVPGC
jgi:phosphatidylglycerophosphate synthase